MPKSNSFGSFIELAYNHAMSQSIIKILESLSLAGGELESFHRYKSDPKSKSFLPVAEILCRYQLKTEAIELLLLGVEQHPQFGLSRVALAREMYEQGMLTNAWHQISHTSVQFQNNFQASLLYLRLALLHDEQILAENAFQAMDKSISSHVKIKSVMDQLLISGIGSVKQVILSDFKKRNVKVLLMKLPSHGNSESTSSKLAEETKQEKPDFSYARNFYQVSLSEIFNPYEQTRRDPKDNNFLGLDSLTMASIYEKQGHYRKAIDIYGRLLKAYPESGLILQKLKQAKKAAAELVGEPVEIDEEIADQMESMEVVDQQISFYKDLLNNVDDLGR